MPKKLIAPTILFVVVIIFSFLILSKNRRNNEQSQIILFYGIGCPNCKIVEEYIKQNQVENKISFAQKEVYYNKKNQKELTEKAEICGIPENSIGVPFLWDGEKCYVGDQDIIIFFNAKISD